MKELTDSSSQDKPRFRFSPFGFGTECEVGSIELKAAFLKSCYTKMGIGIVMMAPIIMTQLQHKWGQSGSGLIVLLFMPLGALMFVFACVDYAKSKGLPPLMGLLGLASIFGLIALSIWPDRYRYNKEAERELRKASRA